MKSFSEIDKEYILNTYNRFPIELTHGIGSEVYDIKDNRYIDLGSGIGVTSFGFVDLGWQMAVAEQLCKLQHTSNLYYTEPCVRLAELLCKKTGFSKVFFSNSGAEANECAIKAARKYAADKKGADYYNIITLKNSFHGRTVTTLAATGQEHYHKLFNPLTQGFLYVPAEDIEALKSTVKKNKIAAIMVECVQGEGGVNALSHEYLSAVAKTAKENDIVLIVDEVQTGNGRTGKLYAYMNYGITPDIVTTAKGLGGGLPIGATLFSEGLKNVLGFGEHGSTFGGNPVCAAGALSIIERIDDTLLAEVAEKSEYIRSELSEAEGVVEITGMGLMLGIKTVKPAAEVVKAAMELGVLCLTAKDKVRLLPALNIEKDILAEAIETLKIALK